MNYAINKVASESLRPPSEKPTAEIEQQFVLIDEALDRLSKAFSTLNVRIQDVLIQEAAPADKPQLHDRCCSSALGERLANIRWGIEEQAKAMLAVAQRVAL